MKQLILLLTSIVCSLPVLAEIHSDSTSFYDCDSIRFKSRFDRKVDAFSSSRLYQMTYIGVPLIIGGVIIKSEDNHFRNLRNDYLPRFNRHADDYLQYTPAVVILGMKVLGVEGRSSWKRMIISDTFSTLLTGSVVILLKQTTHVTRPDESNNRSFPSGHTATAFMSATMLTKEYGHKTPWIGIGAYTAASATGLMRMANNKHWLSDVLAGAGIGILSTELGYYLADLIFKEKGLNLFKATEMSDRMDKPSFISLYLGLNVPLNKYDIDKQTVFRTSSGSSAGMEGAYFFNPYIGFGGRFTVSSTSLIVNSDKAENKTFDAMSLCGGTYFSYPLSSRWLAGSKLLGGYVHYPCLQLSQQTVPSKNGVGFGSGFSLTFKAKEHYGIRFFLDYDLMPSHCAESAKWMNMLTCGASIGVML